MHELGVVFYIIRHVKKVAEENNIDKINRVTLEIGQVSGVIHEQLTDCWNWAVQKERLLQHTDLHIQTLEAISFCEDCKVEYETVKYAKICPSCGSDRTYLLRGREFFIKEIEVWESSTETETSNGIKDYTS